MCELSAAQPAHMRICAVPSSLWSAIFLMHSAHVHTQMLGQSYRSLLHPLHFATWIVPKGVQTRPPPLREAIQLVLGPRMLLPCPLPWSLPNQGPGPGSTSALFGQWQSGISRFLSATANELSCANCSHDPVGLHTPGYIAIKNPFLHFCILAQVTPCCFILFDGVCRLILKLTPHVDSPGGLRAMPKSLVQVHSSEQVSLFTDTKAPP